MTATRPWPTAHQGANRTRRLRDNLRALYGEADMATYLRLLAEEDAAQELDDEAFDKAQLEGVERYRRTGFSA